MRPLSSRSCSTWRELTDALDSFPHQKLGFIEDPEGGYAGLGESSWVFRGSKSASYELRPSIERDTDKKAVTWETFESKILREFQSRARMHLSPSEIPGTGPDEKLSWLSLMRHYGVPTRLLDFTLSPYVALYFALCNRTDADKEKNSPPEVWAIDAQALMRAARKISAEADRHEYEEKQKNIDPRLREKPPRASLVDFSSDADELEREALHDARMVSAALSAEGFRRRHFKEKGFVTLATPPIQNRRLSSQQGLFLFNGALELKFYESLRQMMRGNDDWHRRFEIAGDQQQLDKIERHLFKMNIHHLSLFPDIEGLAEFIRQKMRLEWAPEDNPQLDEPENISQLAEHEE